MKKFLSSHAHWFAFVLLAGAAEHAHATKTHQTKNPKPQRYCYTVTCQWDSDTLPASVTKILGTGKKASYKEPSPDGHTYKAWYNITALTPEGENQVKLFSAYEKNAEQICETAIGAATTPKSSMSPTTTRNSTKELLTSTACKKKDVPFVEPACLAYKGTCTWNYTKLTTDQVDAVRAAIGQAGHRVHLPSNGHKHDGLNCGVQLLPARAAAVAGGTIDIDCDASFSPKKSPAEICQIALQLSAHPLFTRLSDISEDTKKIPAATKNTLKIRVPDEHECR